MSEIRVNKVINAAGADAPNFPYGFSVAAGYGITGGGNITGTAATFSGAVNIDATTDSTSVTTGALIVDGGLGVAKNVYIGAGLSVAGTLTYEDVTNVDAVGLITAKSGINVTAGDYTQTGGGELKVGTAVTISSTAGVATFSGDVVFDGATEDRTVTWDKSGDSLVVADNATLAFGNSSDLLIYHDASNSRIKDTGTGALKLSGSQVDIENGATNETMATFAENGAVTLYNDNSAKLATSATGVTITGNATATQFIGVSTGGTASGATVGVGTTSTILGVTDGATQNRFSGVLVEKASIQATNVTSADGTIDLAQGNVHYYTTNGTGATTAAIKYKGGNNLSSYMKVGENISISIISKPNNSEYINAVTIDGAAVTEEWLGGTTPSAASGAASSYTITNINLTRFAATGTPDNDYLVLVSVLNYA